MTTPHVTEITRQLEIVGHDTFIDGPDDRAPRRSTDPRPFLRSVASVPRRADDRAGILAPAARGGGVLVRAA